MPKKPAAALPEELRQEFQEFRRAHRELQRERYYIALAQPEGLRHIAAGRLDAGCQFMRLAFNLDADPGCPYRFGAEVRE